MEHGVEVVVEQAIDKRAIDALQDFEASLFKTIGLPIEPGEINPYLEGRRYDFFIVVKGELRHTSGKLTGQFLASYSSLILYTDASLRIRFSPKHGDRGVWQAHLLGFADREEIPCSWKFPD